jgi:hypothetical protein
VVSVEKKSVGSGEVQDVQGLSQRRRGQGGRAVGRDMGKINVDMLGDETLLATPAHFGRLQGSVLRGLG